MNTGNLSQESLAEFFRTGKADTDFEVREDYVIGVCALYPDRLAGPQEYAIRERSIVERAGRPLSVCAQEAKDLAFQSAVQRMEGLVSPPGPAASPAPAAAKVPQDKASIPEPETLPQGNQNSSAPEKTVQVPQEPTPELPERSAPAPASPPRRLELSDLRPASSLLAAAPETEPNSEEQRIEKARSIEISILGKVYVCPQGIAAAYADVRTEGMERENSAFGSPMELLAEEAISVLVDIGGGTVDPVVLKYGLPQPMEDENPAKSIIWTYGNIRRDIKARTGQDISEEAVNMVLNGEPVRMDGTSLEIIRSHMDSYANRLLMELREKGLPFATAYTIVQGGGAGFVRDQWKKLDTFAALDFLPEIRATAMGCEVMARRMMLREEQRLEKRVV